MSTFATALRAEFARIWSNRMARISLIALMFIPVIYGGLYLWGNKDPYSALDRVPAALVVADTGASIDGAHENLGREAAKAVEKDGTFDWTRVSLAEAQKGVKSGDYDFALVFPADFSSDLATVSSDAPVKADLRLITNDANSYLSTTIAEKTADTVAQNVATKLGRTASLKLLDGVADLRDGLVQADDGAGRLADGASTAEAGAAQLQSGTAQLSDGATSLAAGTSRLSSGASSLSTGASSLASGLATLDSSTATLPSQAQTLAAGAAGVSSGISQVGSGLTDAAPGLEAAILTSPALTPEQRTQLLAAVQQLQANTSSSSPLVTGAQQVAAGASTLSASAPALRSGITQAHAGADRVAAGASSLASGAASADSGAQRLASGASEAAAGATSLQDGTAQLASGASELHSKLADGVAAAPDHSTAERKAIATAIATPLAVKKTAITSAADYGAGLAPFFISLAGWIGIYALFLLVRPLSRRALTAVRRPIATALAGWALPAALGIVQMIALLVVVAGPLGLHIAHPLGLVLFLALVTACYAAIVHALNVWLGSVGQFLGLLLMVVQLVTAGGTFPWQTLPGPLAVVHRVLPMAHSVDGVRQLMYGVSGPVLGQAILVLAAWTLGALALSIAGAARQSAFRTERQLRPAAIGG